MAGKTSFIKMVGANVVLGRTLGLCTASRAVIPVAGVMTHVRAEHSIESGRSRYFDEIDAVLELFRSLERDDCRLFLIDELLNGTNTLERIAAARAVLEALSDRAQVIVTTHDVELQALMPGRFDLFHFAEAPDAEGFFDYRLRPGPSTERNAIRLLERLGFPTDVVARAMVYAEQPAKAGRCVEVPSGSDLPERGTFEAWPDSEVRR